MSERNTACFWLEKSRKTKKHDGRSASSLLVARLISHQTHFERCTLRVTAVVRTALRGTPWIVLDKQISKKSRVSLPLRYWKLQGGFYRHLHVRRAIRQAKYQPPKRRPGKERNNMLLQRLLFVFLIVSPVPVLGRMFKTTRANVDFVEYCT